MTKQEEIREGIDNILQDWAIPRDKAILIRKRLITFLYGANVVIKVRDIQPINDYKDLTRSIDDSGKYDVVVVEPLISVD